MRLESNIRPFRQLSAHEEFAARLPFDVRRKGREYAVDRRPPSDASSLSAPEQDILDLREIGQNERRSESRTVVIDGIRQVQQLAPASLSLSVETARLSATLVEIQDVHQQDISQRLDAELNAQAHWNAFRDEHGLTRDAEYSTNATMPVLIMALLAMPETLLSTVLLKELVRSGYSGGLILALTAGALTVVLGWLSGAFGVRQIRHINPLRKTLGAVALLLGSLASFIVQLNLAHTREAIEHGMRDVAIVKMIAILGHPSSWLDFSAPAPLLLLIFGTLIYVLAMIKGAGGAGSLVDPYPGYEHVDAGYQRRRADRRLSEEAYRAATVNAHDSYRDEFRRRIVDDATKVIEARLVLKEAEGRQAAIRARAREWDAAVLHAIRDFRTTNASVRARGEPPAYFAEPPSLNDPEQALESSDEIRALVAKFEAVQLENEKLIPTVEEAIARAQEAAVQRVPQDLKKIAIQAEMRFMSNEDSTDGDAPDANGEHTGEEPQTEEPDNGRVSDG
jgi:hypothetical protein